MATLCTHSHRFWFFVMSILGLALPSSGAQALRAEGDCKQVVNGEQTAICETQRRAFDQCRKHYKKCSFGTLGDSMTDEFQGHANIAGLNWVEQLALVRGLDFGRYEENPDFRGEPRNDGFGFNFARWGASATEPTYAEVYPWDLICGGPCYGKSLLLQTIPHFSPQVEGLVAKVAAGRVQVVTVAIGYNDFAIYANALGGTFTDAAFEQLSANIIGRIAGAVDALRAAGPVMILVAQIPDGGFSPAGVEGIGRTNAQLGEELALRGVPMIDIWAYFRDASMFRYTPLPDGTFKLDLMVGDYALPVVPFSVASLSQLVAPDDPRAIGPCRVVGPEWWDPVTTSELKCATLEYELNIMVDDAQHNSTLCYGLVANEFVKAFNSVYGLEIPLLTTNEILGSAGIVPLEDGDDDSGHGSR